MSKSDKAQKFQQDQIGKKFGKLTCRGFDHSSIKEGSLYSFDCECGTTNILLRLSTIQNKKTTASCGCMDYENKITQLKKKYVGQKIGRLTVLDVVGIGRGGARCSYKCDCGAVVEKPHVSVKRGYTSSCGCLKKELISTHGMYKSKEYSSWKDMKNRCNNSNHKSYDHYGGRGIGYDPAWEQFENFILDMGTHPNTDETWTLERLDVNLGYSKENCVWLEKSKQPLNKRNNWTQENIDFIIKQRLDGHTIREIVGMLKTMGFEYSETAVQSKLCRMGIKPHSKNASNPVGSPKE